MNTDSNADQEIINEEKSKGDLPFTTIPVIHEYLEVSKELVETGKIKISKSISEHQEFVNIPLMHEEVNIERVEINEYVDSAPPAVRYEGDIMIIPVLKEVIQKRILLVEEVRVIKRQVQKNETQQVTLRKEEVDIQREDKKEQQKTEL